MGLTLTQLKRVAGLTHSQARTLVEYPFKAAGTAIKRHSAGRRVMTYSFSDLAPRLVMRGICADVIAELAIIAALDNQQTENTDNNEDYHAQ
jgi:hypothetical protein